MSSMAHRTLRLKSKILIDAIERGFANVIKHVQAFTKDYLVFSGSHVDNDKLNKRVIHVGQYSKATIHKVIDRTVKVCVCNFILL